MANEQTPIDHLEPVYTVDEVAHYLKCSTGLVYKLINRGEIRSTRVGTGLIRIPESALTEILDKRTAETDEQ